MPRPTKYKEEYCEMVIEHMQTGKSLASFAASVGTHRQVLWVWRKENPKFNDACNTAIEGAMEYWEEKAAECALGEYVDYNSDGKQIGKRPNAGMIQFIMKQRFYRDYNRQPSQEIDLNIKPKIVYKTSMTEDGRMVQDILEDITKEENNGSASRDTDTPTT
jgi:hypothetical protein